MKILFVSDEECPALWSEGTRQRLREYDLIISAGDLKADYLSFLVTMARCPVLYVHGNHDVGYSRRPPEGCDCIDGKLISYNGLRILGLGGCLKYRPADHQYTDTQMRRRIRKLFFPLRRSKGVDILVTHAPAEGLGDDEDPAHRGFPCFLELLDRLKPRYMIHGHVHLRYHFDRPRILQHGDTTIINASERYVLELPDLPVEPKYKNRIRWFNGEPPLPEDVYEGRNRNV